MGEAVEMRVRGNNSVYLLFEGKRGKNNERDAVE
jgi:hypothetical protein